MFRAAKRRRKMRRTVHRMMKLHGGAVEGRCMRKWMSWIRTIERAALTAWFALRDPRVPLYAKLVQVLGFFYLFLPADLIPDILPFVGMLDDALLMPLATYAFFKLMPGKVLSELRGRADAAVGKWGNAVLHILGGLIVLWTGLALTAGWFLLGNASNFMRK